PKRSRPAATQAAQAREDEAALAGAGAAGSSPALEADGQPALALQTQPPAAPPRRPARDAGPQPPLALNASERRLLNDLFAIVSEHAADPPSGEASSSEVAAAVPIDRARVQDAFVFACEHHADQRRKSGEDFITHPVGVARICASMRLDTETLCAALLHDTVEDTSASIEEVRERFGEDIAGVVDGVTKLTGITFQSRDEAQANNYRKMMVAMATDVRVILIKLADRLHNMRTIDAMPKQKQMEKARETLEIYAPLAHRLGIHAIKWELEDLAFATLHPRKYQEIKGLVAQQRDERERYVSEAGDYLRRELADVGIDAQIAGRAKHFYSIYSKMTKKGREFNEIYDLTAMRVIVDSVKDCYGAVGVIHSLWKPLPGRFKDFVAMPKFNMYQSLHTTVIGPEGRPLEIQIRTHQMHEMAEFGVAAHWVYKQPTGPGADASSPEGEDAKLKWLRSMLDWQKDLSDPREFMETLRTDLFEEEVYVFTPKGEVKSLAAGATPLDFAYEVHTEIGHRCVGARVNGKIVPLHYELRSGDIVEILTAKRERGPSRDWLAMVKTTRARNKIKAWFKAESRQDTEHRGRELLQEHLRKQGLPAQKITGSALLADVIREVGYRKADDFYIALGAAKVSPKLVVGKVLQRLKQGEAADGEEGAADLLRVGRARRRPTKSSGQYGIRVEGVEDVMVRLAKCCRPVPGDEIVGYISLGRGITIHREDCPNAAVLAKSPERFTDVSWEGDQSTGFVVEIQIDAWDRHHLLADLSRAFSESGANILEARCLSMGPMVKNRFVVEVADTHSLKSAVTRLRNVDSVFDAYRVTPGASA
ncbi:MAG TPA: bifunctional (p)ppGpp synthetase/guanosine-3',5'-bis(diphosphate) 3'-pyrophosphohydrolase, partial [Solirubrobacteraceae bacterium]|nr:bifunctional (p)ppGpp synthetase/guanosine-3',5'-bis(diphosphate) 3'-pyrophosphohydrolase [Solirubrobacteraceae bacterium]